ncbi:cell division protein FtsQ/DivIB [Endozoicomonas gorgoniicola]|uniref:Cell division protein FtsQ n=1 Tax=Endozoicomonas gorgoniicola TaxID=1234144 RepID=A0ABT3MW39_9GAMM|nr:cell division protein FtsQ/DivIB [Endozoicomonas gorgoniicola]MCW7553570.1 cell division protein FtsQ/DivIB [Endozoicomonas gorgoniicola]
MITKGKARLLLKRKQTRSKRSGSQVDSVQIRRRRQPPSSGRVRTYLSTHSRTGWQIARVTTVVVFLGAVLWVWPSLMNWLNRPIARVEIHAGFESLNRVKVEAELEPFLVNRFFHLDLEAMRQALLQMPWVREASLRRRWPDRLEVSLQERQAVARWKQDKLITGEGVVFTPGSVSEFKSFPLLSGADDEALEVMQQYLSISQLLRPLGLLVGGLQLGSAGSWRFRVDHVTVYLGRDRRMERLQRFVRLYHARLDSRWNEVERVDMRYLNGASVAWRQN